MELNIGKSVRALRQERNVTQEELANAIGVTAQAVSKWERNEGYPDVTMLPKIARYFGVSLDTVYGVDAKREQREIFELINRVRSIWPRGECEGELREGLEKYPGSFELMTELAYVLTESGKKDASEEAVRLLEEVLDRCTDQKIRNRAYPGLCRAYEYAQRHKDALHAAMNLPDLFQTSAHELSLIYRGEELVEHIQRSLAALFKLADRWISALAEENFYSTEEKIRLHEKMIELYRILTDNNSCPVELMNILLHYNAIAGERIGLGDHAGGLDALGKAADCLLRFQKLPDGEITRHDALLLSRVKMTVRKSPGLLESFVDSWQNQREDLAPVRDTEEFRAVLAKLTEA